MTRQYFGTDGVRGPYGGPLVNEDFVARLAAAAAGGARRGRAFIGRDTRGSGESLAAAAVRGLRAGASSPCCSACCQPPPSRARCGTRARRWAW